MFVRASVEGVIKEAAIAATLTGLMILLFLGSWRSTLIVVVSIPLSIMVSIIILGFLGESLNVMTLGGMALAVGILVDDATVAIENIHRNLHQRKSLGQGDPGRRFADCGARLRRHPVHLHRVRAGRVHQRCGTIPVHAHGNGGGLRHADQLLPQPHAPADDGQLPPAKGSCRYVRRHAEEGAELPKHQAADTHSRLPAAPGLRGWLRRRSSRVILIIAAVAIASAAFGVQQAMQSTGRPTGARGGWEPASPRG